MNWPTAIAALGVCGLIVGVSWALVWGAVKLNKTMPPSDPED